jgi:hypothetical protein
VIWASQAKKRSAHTVWLNTAHETFLRSTRIKRGVFVDLPGEESFTKRTERNEADPKFLERRQKVDATVLLFLVMALRGGLHLRDRFCARRPLSLRPRPQCSLWALLVIVGLAVGGL